MPAHTVRCSNGSGIRASDGRALARHTDARAHALTRLRTFAHASTYQRCAELSVGSGLRGIAGGSLFVVQGFLLHAIGYSANEIC